MKNLNLKFDVEKLRKETENTNWQKAVFGALIVSLIFFLGAVSFLFFRPVPDDIKQSIDTDLKSQEVNFSFKTLDKLKNRQAPNAQIEAPSGKNPFVPF